MNTLQEAEGFLKTLSKTSFLRHPNIKASETVSRIASQHPSFPAVCLFLTSDIRPLISGLSLRAFVASCEIWSFV